MKYSAKYSNTNKISLADAQERHDSDWYRNGSMRGGYGYFFEEKDGEVIEEYYCSCAGNSVTIKYFADYTLLEVDSRRHGIPWIAEKFKGLEPLEVVEYDSQATHKPWYEAGIKIWDPIPADLFLPEEEGILCTDSARVAMS